MLCCINMLQSDRVVVCEWYYLVDLISQVTSIHEEELENNPLQNWVVCVEVLGK